jgi:hypothetical protein
MNIHKSTSEDEADEDRLFEFVVAADKMSRIKGRIIPTTGALGGTAELCMHYCKRGTCKHGSSCRYIHDRSKVWTIQVLAYSFPQVQLCRSFLQGSCTRDAGTCAMSHDLDLARMPECGLFLRNLCIDPNCSYLHVKKPETAVTCDLFVNSWCPRGVDCPLRHYVAPAEKRQREESPEEDDRPEEDEDSLLRRIWEEEPILKMFD